MHDPLGYAKDAVPFAEFVWADFFRPQIPVKRLQPAEDGTLSSVDAVQQAVALARSPAARPPAACRAGPG
jgi:hypothetical protein